MKSPLRYPGGKAQLTNYIDDFITANNLYGCSFYEPYAGGSSVSLHLLDKGIASHVYLNEADLLIASFWRSVFHYTDDLCRLILDTPITIESWNNAIRFRDNLYCARHSCVEIGFAGLFLNRTNFSGILNANPLGGKTQQSQYKIDCRFNKEKLIKSIRMIAKYKDKVSVSNMDAIDSVKSSKVTAQRTFVYMDPPYYQQGKLLYRHYYETKDHERLANFITSKAYPWLISYDDCIEIENLYRSRSNYIQTYFDYSAYKSKSKQPELLISNRVLPPLENMVSFASLYTG